MITRGVDPAAEDRLAGTGRNSAAAAASAGSTTPPRRGRRFRDFSDGPIEDLGPVAAARAAIAESPAATDHAHEGVDARAMAARSVAQARQACDELLVVAHRLVDTFGGQADSVGKGARGMAERAMTFAERDIANSFEFAQKLVRARNLQEVMKLQAEYLQARMQLFSPKS